MLDSSEDTGTGDLCSTHPALRLLADLWFYHKVGLQGTLDLHLPLNWRVQSQSLARSREERDAKTEKEVQCFGLHWVIEPGFHIRPR